MPDDLIQFLLSGRKLKYDAKEATPGRIIMQSLDALRVGQIYAAPRKRGDPNSKKSGVYRIPAISLVAECKHYDPAYILSYLPLEQAFAAFDGDHAIVTVFSGASWLSIEANPVPYLNAQWDSWDGEPGVKVVRNVNWGSRYVFFEGARY